MSQFELDQEYKITGIDLVDSMAEVATLHEDAEERLKMFAAIGKVASGILEFEQILQPEDAPKENPQLDRVAVEAKIAQSGLAVVEPLIEDPVDSMQKDEVALETATTEVAAAEFLLPEVEGLPLTARQMRAFEAIRRTNGVPFRPADIKEFFGDISDAAKKQAFRALIAKIRASSYAGNLEVSGKTTATRYVWREEHIADSETASEEIALVPTSDETEDYADEIANLSFIGMDLKIDGVKKYIDIRGIPLKLDNLAVDILIELGMHEGRMVLADLLKSERIQGHNLDGHNQDTLRQSLHSIERLMSEHNILWRDAKVPVDGRTVRKLVLGDLGEIRLRKQAAQDIDFLDQGE